MVTAPPEVIHAHPAVLEMARTRYDTEPRDPSRSRARPSRRSSTEWARSWGPRVDRRSRPAVPRPGGRARRPSDTCRRCDGRARRRRDVGRRRRTRQVAADTRSTGARSIRGCSTCTQSPTAREQLPGRARSTAGAVRISVATTRRHWSISLRDTVRQRAPQLEPYLPLIGDALQLPVPSTPEADAIDPQYRPDRTADGCSNSCGGPRRAARCHRRGHALGGRGVGAPARSDRRRDASRPWLLIAARRDDEGGFTPESVIGSRSSRCPTRRSAS